MTLQNGAITAEISGALMPKSDTGDKISKEKCLFSGNGDERWPIRFQLNAAIRTHPIGAYVQAAKRLPGGAGKEDLGLKCVNWRKY